MSSHSYEVALFGEFFSQDLNAILNRITVHSELSQPFRSQEILFEPLDAQSQRDSGIEPILLRAKKEMSGEESSKSKAAWELFSYLKPESVRVHPEATVRPWTTCQVIGDALSFAAALGYAKRSQIYKAGYAFRRGPLVILMFQQEQVDPATNLPIPAHPDTLWEVEVKTANPIKTQETSLKDAIAAVLEVQLLMKGLLDLRRLDV